MNDNKPFAPACERNQAPIMEVLRELLPAQACVLEIGSGTGQHAAYFCQRQTGWRWQCSDLAPQLDGIRQWLAALPDGQCPPPIVLDVLGDWPEGQFNAVYTANTLHIMPWRAVKAMFARVAEHLSSNGRLICYGPFRENGVHISPSNAEFDIWLKQRDPSQGVRDREALMSLADQAGLVFKEQRTMPANNSLLIWQRADS